MSSLENFLGKKLSGGEIKEIRRLLNISQDRLGREIGVTGMTIYSWEREKTTISEKYQGRVLALLADLRRDGTAQKAE